MLATLQSHGPGALPLRSALVSFVGPAGGNVDVKTTVLRRGKAKGKGMAFVRAEMFAAESGELATSCQFAFGADRLASAFHSTMGVDDPPAALPGPLYLASPARKATLDMPRAS